MPTIWGQRVTVKGKGMKVLRGWAEEHAVKKKKKRKKKKLREQKNMTTTRGGI